MKKLSARLLANTVASHRKEQNLTQAALAKLTGINRALLSRLESQDFTPSVDQLHALAEVLHFDPTRLFTDPEAETAAPAAVKACKITVAGVGYVGLSLAVLFAQNHEVTAITTTPKKAERLNQFISPIQDDEIERFFREANA